MSDFKTIDSCETMENLRAVRSYNDLVVIFSSIRQGVESVINRLHKKADIQGSGLLSDIKLLESYSYSIQFSKTLAPAVSDKKIQKFRMLCSSTENLVNTTIAQAYSLINAIGAETEPATLSDLASMVQTYLSKMLNKSMTSIVIPESATTYTHYFILKNVMTNKNYIMGEFIVALHWDSFNGSESTQISFPTKMLMPADRITISKRNVVKVITDCMNSEVIGVNLNSRQKDTINKLDNVSKCSIVDNHLLVELTSGIAPGEINAVLTSLLPVLFQTLGIEDPRKDIIHRVVNSETGSKCIKVALMDRNFTDSKALLRLKRVLSLDSNTYKTLSRIAGF